MPDNHQFEWQCPAREAPPEYIKGWCDELTQNGDKWVQSQPGLKNLSDDIRLLMGIGQDRDLESNLLQPDIRTFVETVTDLRQIATLGSRAAQMKKLVPAYNDTFKYVYWNSQFVWNSRKAVQWAMLGRGYVWQKWSRPLGCPKARIVFDPLGPRELLPDQLPADNDVQRAYACTIVRPMPIWEAHARFPQFQRWLLPISRYDWKTYGTLGMQRRYDFYDRWRFNGEQGSNWDNKYAEVRYHYIHDLRINTTGQTQQMGIDGTSWGYQVPSLGDLVVNINPYNQLPESHKATVDEARMYPQLRLIITCPSVPVPMYDDTAFDWHGEIPVSQYDVNDWAWSAIGYSAVSAVRGLEVARRDRISDVNTTLAVKKNPPLGHDVSTGVARTQMEKLDLLHAQGVRVGGKGDPSKWVRSLLPEGVDVDDKDFKGIQMLGDSVKASLGLTDIASLRELKGNLSENDMDKVLENLGPMAKGIAVNMWRANGKHAHMLKYNIAQYWTVDDLLTQTGPEGLDIQTLDNDPNSIVPSHLPNEDNSAPSRHRKRDRAYWFCERMGVVSTPAQLLNITHMQERMLYMFFLQKGVPVSMATTMAKLGVDDFDVERNKWREEKINDAMWEIDVKKAVMVKLKQEGMEPPPEQGPGQGHGGGRPNTGKKGGHPEMKGSKSGQVRVVNSTS